MTHTESLEIIGAGAELNYVPELIKIKQCLDNGDLVGAKNMLELMGSDGETCWNYKCWDLAESL